MGRKGRKGGVGEWRGGEGGKRESGSMGRQKKWVKRGRKNVCKVREEERKNYMPLEE